MKRLTALMILLLGCLLVAAQSFNKQKIDSLIDLIEKFDKSMGSVSVFYNDKEVYQRAFGYADVENAFKADANTKYRIGSVSKVFTATIILKLIEEGKLTLETKLEEFYTEVPNADKITIEQLLRHRSGLFDFINTRNFLENSKEPQTRIFLITQIISSKPVFEPDEKVEYSKTNYILLSYIIEKIENKDFDEVLRDKILIPCNLKNTNYGGLIDTRKNEALSYKKLAFGWEVETSSDMNMNIPTGAGGIVSTPSDLNKFLFCLFTSKIISEPLLDKMTDMTKGYGLGLTKIPFYERYSYGKGGAIDAFIASMSFFPEENLAFSGILNGSAFSLNDLLTGIKSIWFDREYHFPLFTSAIEVSRKELELYPGNYSSISSSDKLTILLKENQIYGQATGGGPSFPLEPFDKNKFRVEVAGLEFEFFPSENKLIVKQHGTVLFEMMRE